MMEVSSPPEYAKTTLLGNGFSLGKQRVQDRLLNMQAIFCLIVDDRARRIDDAFADLETPVGGQAVQEDGIWRSLREERFVDLISGEGLFASGGLGFLAHARPDVGVNGLRARDGFLGLAEGFDFSAGFAGDA